MITIRIIITYLILSSVIFAQDLNNRNYLSSNQIKDRIYSNLEKLDLYFLKKLSSRDYNASKELIVDTYLLLFSVSDFEYEDIDYVMSDFDFNILLNDLREESFTEDKLSLIEVVSINNYFTVSQVFQILETIDFSSDRIQAFQLLFPAVVDKYNSYRILSLFSNSADKQTVRNLISNYFYKKR